MRICTIGGTRFSGRAFTGLALEQGHEVTIFHRGGGRGGGEEVWPDAEHVHGDRDGGLGALSPGSFDAVVDFCAFVPRQVREAIAVAGDGRYVFISSVSAHLEEVRAGATEDDDVYAPPFPDTEDVTWETYGPLKVASEYAVRDAIGDAGTIVRPHFIVGPYDPTDRFTSWVRRAASGGRILAPAPAAQPLQWIDARDLAAFVAARVHVRRRGHVQHRDAAATPLAPGARSRPRPPQGACRSTSRGATTRSSGSTGWW